MAITQLKTTQIGTNAVNRDDLDVTTTTKAVVVKVIAGTNVTLGSTGVDAGTGDVTVNWSQPALALSILTLASNFTITAGYCAQVIRIFKINSGVKLTIGLASIFKID